MVTASAHTHTHTDTGHTLSNALFLPHPGNVFNLCIKHDVDATGDRLSEDFLGILLLCTV